MKKILITITLILIILFGVFWFYENKINCREEYNILISQYIDSTNVTHGGNCSQGCLFMKVLKVRSALYYGLNDYSQYENEFRTLFFANENKLRNDLEKNHEIKIKWCSTKYGERVRGISSTK